MEKDSVVRMMLYIIVQGELFFTDPPYGLQTQDDDDPKKEIPFKGCIK